MKKRSPIAVLLLPFITFGIYSIYWLVATKIEMNKQGAKIPTAWLLIIPIVNIWWLWKLSEGAEQVTKEKMSGVLAFILLFFLGFIGQAIIQSSLNTDAGAVAPAATPAETPAPTPPATEPSAEAPKEETPKDAASAETPAVTESKDTQTPPATPLVQ